MKTLLLIALLCFTSIAWASSPCERTIEMDSPTVLKTISLDPLRGVTFRFPFALQDHETLYAISDTQMVKLNKSRNTNIVVVQSLKFGKEVLGRKIDLTIANKEYSFILTLVIESKPNNRYCSLVSFQMSDQLLAELKEKEQTKKQSQAFMNQQQALVDKLATEKAFDLFSRLIDIKPKKRRINKRALEKIPGQGRIIARVDKVETYADIHVIHGVVINDTKEPLTVQSIHVNINISRINTANAFSIKKETIKAGKSSPYKLTTNAVLNQGAEVTVNTSNAILKVRW